MLLSPDGKQTRDLGAKVLAATWSRDGKTIFAIRAEPSQAHVYRVDLVSAKWQALTEFPLGFSPVGFYGGIARLSPAPDGKSVALTTFVHDGDIWILDGFESPRTFWESLWPFKR